MSYPDENYSDSFLASISGLTSLTSLNLIDNELESIPSPSFEPISNLAELYLSGNPLLTVPADAFQFFRGLNTLHLSSCRIDLIQENGFRGLGTLKRLKMADNNFAKVPSQSFSSVAGLEELDLGRNPLSVLHSGDFKDLSKLKTFDLTGCGRLILVEDNVFENCVDLQRITISLNRQLTFIPGAAFDAMPSLRFLNLADNALETFNPDEFRVNWDHVSSLDLSGNPWRCDCDLISLLNIVKSKNSSAKCVLPHSLSDRPLSSLERDEFDCQHVVNNEIGAIRNKPEDTVVKSHGTESSQRQSGSQTVIISVSVVSIVLLIFLIVLLVLKFRQRAEEWWDKRRHHRSPGGVDPGADVKSVIGRSPAIHDPLHQDHSAQHHHRPANQQRAAHAREYRLPDYSCEDEHYYYVATMQNRLASGKNIPVTEL